MRCDTVLSVNIRIPLGSRSTTWRATGLGASSDLGSPLEVFQSPLPYGRVPKWFALLLLALTGCVGLSVATSVVGG